MKENKYLITVTNLDLLELKVKNTNFLFPMNYFSVGYKTVFSYAEITTPNSYLYINRILNNEDIKNLKKELAIKNKNIIGLCFTDLGLLNVVKELKLKVKLIYMQNHNTTNKQSIAYYLEYFDSVLVSTDITEDELNLILDASKKPLVVPYFMRVDTCYSRRTLLTNYQENFNLAKKDEEILHEEISNQDFLAVENEYGTVLYASNFIDYRKFNHKNILFRYINPIGLSLKEVEQILNQEEIKPANTGFLHKETYYSLKEGTHE